MNLLKQFAFYWLALLPLIIPVDGFYKNLLKAGFYKLTNGRKCYKLEYTYFQKTLYEVCAYFTSDTADGESGTSNIFLRKSKNNGKDWGEEVKVQNVNITGKIKNLFLFKSKKKAIVLYSIIKSEYLMDLYVIDITNEEPYEAVSAEYENLFLKKINVTGHVDSLIHIQGQHYFLICGSVMPIHENNRTLVIMCVGSLEDENNWRTPFYFYEERKNVSRYLSVYPEFSNSNIQFRISNKVTSQKGVSYLKCQYEIQQTYKCFSTSIDYRGMAHVPQNADIKKRVKTIQGHIFGVESITEKTNGTTGNQYCIMYYLQNSVFIIRHKNENSTNELSKCDNPNIMPLEDYRFMLTYEANENTYGYIFNFSKTVVHCSAVIGSGDNIIASKPHTFHKKENDGTYNCIVNYEDLGKEGDKRYLIVRLNKDMQTKLANCFFVAYDNYLKPVPLFNKLEYVDEGEFGKLHILYMNEYLYKQMIVERPSICSFGNKYNIKVHFHIMRSFTFTNCYDCSATAFYARPTDILYYNFRYMPINDKSLQILNSTRERHFIFKLPNSENLTHLRRKRFINHTNTLEVNGKKCGKYDYDFNPIVLPPNMKYVIDGYTYIIKIPSYMDSTYETCMHYRNRNLVNVITFKVIFAKGGEPYTIYGYDASDTHTLYTINNVVLGNDQSKNIQVTVPVEGNKKIILGLVCATDDGTQSDCFTDVYKNDNMDKTIPIANILNDPDANTVIPVRTYLLTHSKSIYIETNLILLPQYIKQFQTGGQKEFKCKCKSPKNEKIVTYTLIPKNA